MASLSYKLRILRGLLTGERARAAPYMVLVDTTRRCNLACPGCRYHAPDHGRASPGDATRTEFSTDMFERLCAELGDMGVSEVVLTGDGEPLLHGDLRRLVEISAGGPFETSLLTNGTLLDESSIRDLISAGLDVLTISLWAATPGDSARSHPGIDPALFSSAVRALGDVSRIRTEMRRTRPRVRLYLPITRLNAGNLSKLVDLAMDARCDELHLSPFRARRGRHGALALDPAEVTTLVGDLGECRRRLDAAGIGHNVDRVLLRYRLGEDAWKKLPCYVGWVQAHVKPDGTVFPCNSCEEPMGSLESETFAAIWNGPAFRGFRRNMLSLAGREAVAGAHDCGFCGQIPDNRRIHRIFRWFRPMRRRPTLEGG